MENLPFHPHYDVWALIVSLVIFFELSTKDKTIKKDKRKCGIQVLILWVLPTIQFMTLAKIFVFCSFC